MDYLFTEEEKKFAHLASWFGSNDERAGLQSFASDSYSFKVWGMDKFMAAVQTFIKHSSVGIIKHSMAKAVATDVQGINELEPPIVSEYLFCFWAVLFLIE